MDPICGGCRATITNPIERVEKKFIVVETGQIVLMRRHDDCAKKYSGAFRLVASEDEAKRSLSPAAVRSRGLAKRRAAARAAGKPGLIKKI